MGTPMHQAGESAKAIADEASGAASSVVGTAKDESMELVHETKDQARALLDEARHTAKQEIDNQAARVGEGLHRLGGEFESMASGSNEPDGIPAEVARRVGSGLDAVATKLDRDGVEGMVDDVKRYARQNPMVFLAGAAAAGFVIGRVVRNMNRQAVLEVAKHHAAGDSDQSDGQLELPTSQEFTPDPSLLDDRTQAGVAGLDEPYAPPVAPAPQYAGLQGGNGHG